VSDEQPIHKKRRKLRAYHVLILALIVGVGWFGLYRRRLKSRLQGRIDAIRAAGHPVDLGELDGIYDFPEDGENAALVIIEAASHYNYGDLPELPGGGLPHRTESLTPETRSIIVKHLTNNAQTLELLHEAATIGHSRYPGDICVPYPFFETSSVSKGVRVLTFEAIVNAGDKKSGSAVKSVVSAFAIVDSLTDLPTYSAQITRIGYRRVAVSTTEQVLNRTEFTEEQLIELGRAIVDSRSEIPLVKTFAAERCLLLDVLRRPRDLEGEVVNDRPLFGVTLEFKEAMGDFDKLAVMWLDLISDYIDVVGLPECERQKAALVVDAQFVVNDEEDDLFGHVMIPLGVIIISDLSMTACVRGALTGVAIERYRLDSGKLPDSLGELVPAYLDSVSRDPFDGAEMRYRRLETGYVVYSVGEDGSDDGGRERLGWDERKDPEENWDVTFIVER